MDPAAWTTLGWVVLFVLAAFGLYYLYRRFVSGYAHLPPVTEHLCDGGTHYLSYITADEHRLLVAKGGLGLRRPGTEGVPCYPNNDWYPAPTGWEHEYYGPVPGSPPPAATPDESPSHEPESSGLMGRRTAYAHNIDPRHAPFVRQLTALPELTVREIVEVRFLANRQFVRAPDEHGHPKSYPHPFNDTDVFRGEVSSTSVGFGANNVKVEFTPAVTGEDKFQTLLFVASFEGLYVQTDDYQRHSFSRAGVPTPDEVVVSSLSRHGQLWVTVPRKRIRKLAEQ